MLKKYVASRLNTNTERGRKPDQDSIDVSIVFKMLVTVCLARPPHRGSVVVDKCLFAAHLTSRDLMLVQSRPVRFRQNIVSVIQ